METHSPGAARALLDNPGSDDVVAALEALARRRVADEDAVAERLEERIRAALSARARLRRVLRAALAASAAGVAAAVAVVVFSASPSRPDASEDGVLPVEAAALLARQRPDGSWLPERGGAALAPAATGAAVLRLLAFAEAAASPAASAALDRAAAWLRAAPLAEFSSSGSASGAWNLALGTSALLALYGRGANPELFNAADSAVAAVRERLADPGVPGAPSANATAWLASALARADALEWPDSASGGVLRRVMPRLAGLPCVSGRETAAEMLDALQRLPAPAES